MAQKTTKDAAPNLTLPRFANETRNRFDRIAQKVEEMRRFLIETISSLSVSRIDSLEHEVGRMQQRIFDAECKLALLRKPKKSVRKNARRRR